MASLNTRITNLEEQLAMLMKDKLLEVAQPEEEQPKKKRTNGYILYCKENRGKAYENLHNASEEEPKGSEIVKELAYMWKKFLTEEERKAWNDKAKEERE